MAVDKHSNAECRESTTWIQKKSSGIPPAESIMKQGDHFMPLQCSTTIKHQNNISRDKKHCKNTPLKKKLFLKHELVFEKNSIFSLNSMKIKRNILTLLVTTVKNPSRGKIFSILVLQNVNQYFFLQWLSHSKTNRSQKQPILYCSLMVV